MKLYYNNNDLYGEAGPHEAESMDALANEYQETFKQWAQEEDDRGRDERIEEIIQRLRQEFIDGLEEVFLVNAYQIIEDIDEASLEDGEIAYINSKGEWTRSTNGNQPSNTFCVSYSDLNAMPLTELAYHLQGWLEVPQ